MADDVHLEPAQIHRVDPRLVHATLLEAWVPHLGAKHLVVADAAVARDSRRRLIFEMSARDVGRTYFVHEAEVARLLGDLPPEEPTIVVYASLPAFARALSSGLGCVQVIVGHLPDGEGRRRVHPSVYVGPEELDWVGRIRALGVDVVVRPLPTDRPLGLRQGEDERPVLTEDLPTASRPSEVALSNGDVRELSGPSTATAGVEKTASGAQSAGRSAASAAGGHPDSGPQGAAQGLTGMPTPVVAVRKGTVDVVNERGLHLRAAHILAQRTGTFRSSVEVGWPGQMVNAKSLLGLTTLGAARGSRLELRVEGADADAAFEGVVALFASGFEEGSE